MICLVDCNSGLLCTHLLMLLREIDCVAYAVMAWAHHF